MLAFRSRSVALWGALLFAVQPAQVSAVAWIGGRTDSLCTFLISVFFLMLISGALSAGARRQWLLAASIASFALAALAKEQALFLLPLAPLALHIFREKSSVEKTAGREIVIFTALYTAVAAVLLTSWATFGQPLHPKWNLLRQLPLIGQTIDYYTLLLLLTPVPRLNHIMTLYSMQKLGAAGIAVGYIIGILAIVLLIRLLRTNPRVGWFYLGALLLLAPVSNIYPMTTQTIAPYRAGTAGLCAAAVLGCLMAALVERGRTTSPARLRPALIAAPICIYVVWLCWFTYNDDGVWKNSLSASLAVERYDPDSVFGWLETANGYLEFGKFDPAMARLDKVAYTLQHPPANGSRSDSTLAWSTNNSVADWAAGLYGRAGLLKLDAGDRQTALSVLEKGRALSPKNEQVNAGLANCALRINDYASAEAPIRNVLAVEPTFTGLRLRLGKFLVKQQRWREADKELTICLSQQPNDLTVYLLTAMARLKYGNRSGAADILSDGLKRRVLEADKLQDWLKAIGESGLLNARGV